MSTHTYHWYQLPGRAALLLGTLAKSFWRDWFPRECQNCYYSRDKGFTTLDCTFGCGEGYGRPVWRKAVCEHYKTKRKD